MASTLRLVRPPSHRSLRYPQRAALRAVGLAAGSPGHRAEGIHRSGVIGRTG